MNELLKLFGYKAQEIDTELPRVKKVFDKLGITAEDIERGKQRLTKYYDIELEGIRKALRLCMQELVDSVLAREEGKTKFIYGFMSVIFETIGSALVSRSKEVYAAHHCWAFLLILSCIFDKFVPVLEAAEKKWLKVGVVAHCSNVKSLLGLISLDLIPRPDLVITAGHLCETSPKTLDLLHEIHDIPVCCYDTCQDRELSEFTDATTRAIDLSAKSLRKLVERVQEIVGFEITDDMLWEVINAKGKVQAATRQLRDLVTSSDPLPICATNDNIWMCLNSLTLSLDRMPEAVDAINTAREELQERVNKGQGVVEKGAPRVLSILFSQHADPRLEYLANEMGIAIVASDTAFTLPYESKTKDPYIKMSMHIRGSIYTSTARRIAMIIEGCKRLNVDGVLDRFHAGCRTVAGDALLIEDAIKKELGIPVLLLEWENFDPRVYNHEQYKKRLEVFKTMMAKRAG